MLNFKTMDWEKLKVFYQVSKSKSVSRAAEILNMSQSALSRSITQLENRLNVILFHRHSKGMELTSKGKILQNKVTQMLALAEAANLEMQEDENKVAGSLKITSSSGLATFYISSYLPDFLKQYPEIFVTLIGKDDEPELEIFEADIAIRPYMNDLVNFEQVYLMTTVLKLYASPEYLNHYGTPQTVNDLKDHRLIVFGDYKNHPFATLNWSLVEGSKRGEIREPYAQVNSTLGRAYLADAGLGIAILPENHPSLQQFKFVEVLPQEYKKIDIYCIFSKQLSKTKKIQVFIEYLIDIMIKKGYRVD